MIKLSQQCDLSRTDDLEERLRDLLKAVSEDGSRKIDHIAYTAGNKLDIAGGLPGTDLKVINSLMAVRVFAPILIAKVIAATDYVNKSAAASFTFTSGTAHIRPRVNYAMVAMLSGALQGLASGLAFDLAPVRVNVVNPGAIQTELWNSMPAGLIEKAKENSLTKKIAQPEDIAEAYLYFMKDPSVDGTAVTSDNGRVLFT